jgi:Flp pilus assembly protein TadD
MQYWQNLVRLLVAAGDLNEAQDKLELFRSANTYSGNESIYLTLQGSIDDARKQQTTSARLEPPSGS